MPVLFQLVFRNFSLFILPILPYPSATDPTHLIDDYFFINKNKTRPLRGLVLFIKFGFEILKKYPGLSRDYPGFPLDYSYFLLIYSEVFTTP